MLRAAFVGLVVISFASAARAECQPGKPCNDPKSVPAAKPIPTPPGAKPTPPPPAAPTRVDSCDAARKRETDLVKRLAVSERRLAEANKSLAAAKQSLADMNASQVEEIRRLEEETRKLNAKLK